MLQSEGESLLWREVPHFFQHRLLPPSLSTITPVIPQILAKSIPPPVLTHLFWHVLTLKKKPVAKLRKSSRGPRLPRVKWLPHSTIQLNRVEVGAHCWPEPDFLLFSVVGGWSKAGPCPQGGGGGHPPPPGVQKEACFAACTKFLDKIFIFGDPQFVWARIVISSYDCYGFAIFLLVCILRW